jgi:predicted Rossmann fold flavoprotein
MLQNHFDVIVIGGGASGMMVAGQIASSGARVLLLEKNETLGKKLRITGGGRCNLTNALFDSCEMAKKFGDKGKFLLPALARFGVSDTLNFFHQRGLPTKIEAENRVFPKSERAEDVWGVLAQELFAQKVVIQYQSVVEGFVMEQEKIAGVRVNGLTLTAEQYIVATGGTSLPDTGSTGDGFVWLKEIGHTISEPDASLVPITIQDPWVRQLQGTSCADARLTLIHRGEKKQTLEGKLLFTHFGLSGPLALTLSRSVKECFGKGKTELSLDILLKSFCSNPDIFLQEIFSKNQNKKLKNGLKDFIPNAFVETALLLANLNPDAFIREVTKEERRILCVTVRDMRMTVSGFLGLNKAIVSSGGVKLSEVDFKTMQSRLHPNLLLIGDILDLNRPSGGFSLQVCWTTAMVAALYCQKFSLDKREKLR